MRSRPGALPRPPPRTTAGGFEEPDRHGEYGAERGAGAVEDPAGRGVACGREARHLPGSGGGRAAERGVPLADAEPGAGGLSGNRRNSDPGGTAAAAVLVALPVLIASLALQRRMISGMLAGAVRE
ncbi:hypothetical protein AA958_32695 [Streptomyces sp. CNQ-509]|nr:hypothetical protein AA958_32695 [Streptomyces sp. CNQ-509]